MDHQKDQQSIHAHAGNSQAGHAPAGHAPVGHALIGLPPAGQPPDAHAPDGHTPAGHQKDQQTIQTHAGHAFPGQAPPGHAPAFPGQAPPGHAPAFPGQAPPGHAPAGHVPAVDIDKTALKTALFAVKTEPISEGIESENTPQLKESEDNPWDVESLQAFLCLKCPECGFDTQEKDSFQNHAIENHPLSTVLFVKKFKKEKAKTRSQKSKIGRGQD